MVEKETLEEDAGREEKSVPPVCDDVLLVETEGPREDGGVTEVEEGVDVLE